MTPGLRVSCPTEDIARDASRASKRYPAAHWYLLRVYAHGYAYNLAAVNSFMLPKDDSLRCRAGAPPGAHGVQGHRSNWHARCPPRGSPARRA